MRHDMTDIDAFMSEVSDLGAGALLAVTAAHRGQDRRPLMRARATARQAAARLGRSGELDRLSDELMRWALASAPPLGLYGGFGPPSDRFLADARADAVPALVDIAAGVLLRDAIDPATASLLLAPWQARRGTRRGRRSRVTLPNVD